MVRTDKSHPGRGTGSEDRDTACMLADVKSSPHRLQHYAASLAPMWDESARENWTQILEVAVMCVVVRYTLSGVGWTSILRVVFAVAVVLAFSILPMSRYCNSLLDEVDPKPEFCSEDHPTPSAPPHADPLPEDNIPPKGSVEGSRVVPSGVGRP
jgi:hypothetical protein